MNSKMLRAVLWATIIVTMLALAPAPVLAQDELAPTNVLTGSGAADGTIQITADSPQAIRTLLEGEAVVPGGYANYGWATFWGLVFGGLGGLVFELLRLRGLLPLPHIYPPGQTPDTDLFSADGYVRPKRVVDLGFVARVFVGAMAALAVLLVVSPPQRMQFIAATILAGSAGASIFDSLRARLTASLAVADAADVRIKSEDLQQRLNEMETLVNRLLEQSRAAAPVAAAVPAADVEGATGAVVLPAATPKVDSELIDQLSRVLGEAKGIRSAMAHPRNTN